MNHILTNWILVSLILVSTVTCQMVMPMAVDIKNGYPGLSIWVTIYKSDSLGLIRTIVGAKCLKSGEEASINFSNVAGSVNYARSELKFQDNCQGETIDDTTIQTILYSWHTLLPQTNFRKTYWAVGKYPVAPPIDTTLPQAKVVTIHSRTGNFVLSPDQSSSFCKGVEYLFCQLVIRTYVPGNSYQQWLQYDLPGGAILLAHKSTGHLVNVAPGNGNPVNLVPNNSVNLFKAAWTIGGDRNNNCAIRPLHDDGQNLNVLGNGPYNEGRKVGTWGWGGGDPNETWYFRTV